MLQILTNSLLAASIYALVGVGFGLTYQVTRCLNFTHGVLITTGAYGLYVFKGVLGYPWLLSLPLALGTSIIMSLALYVSVFGPLRRLGASPLGMLLASLGAYVVLQNMISMVFGDRIQTVYTGPVTQGLCLLGMRLTSVQISTILASVLCITISDLLLRASRVGTMMRAYANNSTYAEIVGISSTRILLMVSGLSSVLAGVAGIAMGMDIGITPAMGMQPFMMGVVAVVVGGNRHAWGIALGALLLTVAQNLGGWILGSQWQNVVAFLVLVLFLVFRPQGFLGRPLWKGSV